MRSAIALALLVSFAARADPPADAPTAGADAVEVKSGIFTSPDGAAHDVSGGAYLPQPLLLDTAQALVELRAENKWLKWLLASTIAAGVAAAFATYEWGRLSR